MHAEEIMTVKRSQSGDLATAARPSKPFPGAGWQRITPIQGTGADPPTLADFEVISENCDTSCCATEVLADSGMIKSPTGLLSTPTATPKLNVNPPAFQFTTASGEMVNRKTLGAPML